MIIPDDFLLFSRFSDAASSAFSSKILSECVFCTCISRSQGLAKLSLQELHNRATSENSHNRHDRILGSSRIIMGMLKLPESDSDVIDPAILGAHLQVNRSLQ